MEQKIFSVFDQIKSTSCEEICVVFTSFEFVKSVFELVAK